MNANDSIAIDELKKPYFVWFEENWIHDNILHQHQKGQLVYVESGFQYITIEEKNTCSLKTMLPGFPECYP